MDEFKPIESVYKADEWAKCDHSSNIESALWEEATGDLLIRFSRKTVETDGRTHYRYKNVPKDHLDKMLLADSPGKYFAEHIKPFPFVKEKLTERMG